jgi:hypothetical protein
MIKGFLSIIYNNIISTCYDTNKRNSDYVNVNNNRELFKDEFSYYDNIKLTNLDPYLNDNIKLFDQERNDLFINNKNNYDFNEELKEEQNRELKEEQNRELKEDDLSSCCSDIYDKVEDILD